jgi:hypothetical protein
MLSVLTAFLSMRCVSRAYAKFMLSLFLSTLFASSREFFLECLVDLRSENCVSEAYARHMMYIRDENNEKNERERDKNSDSACHEISICQASSEQDFIFRFLSDEVTVED